jgi:hypothetical protein
MVKRAKDAHFFFEKVSYTVIIRINLMSLKVFATQPHFLPSLLRSSPCWDVYGNGCLARADGAIFMDTWTNKRFHWEYHNPVCVFPLYITSLEVKCF